MTVLADCGAKLAIETRIGALKEEASEALVGAPLSKKGRELLIGAIAALAERNT